MSFDLLSINWTLRLVKVLKIEFDSLNETENFTINGCRENAKNSLQGRALMKTIRRKKGKQESLSPFIMQRHDTLWSMIHWSLFTVKDTTNK